MTLFNSRRSAWSRWAALAALPCAAALTGCGGGSSETVISTGFPTGSNTDSFFNGNLTLTANNLSQAVTFNPPQQVSDGSLQTQSGLTPVSGTGYHLFPPNPAFPSPVTLKIKFGALPNQPGTSTPVPAASLFLYYLDNSNVWQPVLPSAGGFHVTYDSAASSGTLSTTISQIQGQGIYAIFSTNAPQTPSGLVLVPASNTPTHGSPFTITVRDQDAQGNVIPTYNGTVHFTSSDGSAVLPADTALTNGTATVNVTLNSLGNQSITATDTTQPATVGSATVNVQ